MQAMHGSAGSRGRLIGCCIALALAASALVLAPSAGAAVTHETKTYLALGDSLAFGYTAVKHTENAPGDSPAYFEEGYADFFAKKARTNKVTDNKGLVLVNDGCPGETTDSFEGEGVNIGLGTNCNYQALFATFGPGTPGGPLHNPYPGKSQKANMLLNLAGGSPKHPIAAVTLNIGANDELAGVSKCKAEVKKEYEETYNSKGGGAADAVSIQPKGAGPGNEVEYHLTPTEVEGAIGSCVGFVAVTQTFPHIQARLKQILNEIYEAGKYTGQVGVLGNYNPFTFILSGSDALQKLLNERLAETINKTGESYSGKVVFANPFLKINGEPEGTKAEQTKICKYTEMCNPAAQAETAAAAAATQKKEEEAGKFIFFPHNPAEGDIHPTKLGYEQLGKIMYEALPI
jgi:lysophospholipase L1-like esterase